MPIPLVRAIQQRTAIVAAGPSTVRGAGGKGVVLAAREFLAELDLRRFSHSKEIGFHRRLDSETECLRKALPPAGRSWGVARKVLNVFLLNTFYNHFLRRHYRLARSAAWFEVPLDSFVSEGLYAYPFHPALPHWPGVKHLTPNVSDHYQLCALAMASEFGVHRVHLDAYLWTAGHNRPASWQTHATCGG